MPIRRKEKASRAAAGMSDIAPIEADELPKFIDPKRADMDREQRDRETGQFKPGNTLSKGPRFRFNIRTGVNYKVNNKDLARFLKEARKYAARRRRELAALFGGRVSYGVCALVDSEAQARAWARYFGYLASRCKDPDKAVNLLTKSSKFEVDARQFSLSAFEVASREAKARFDKPEALDLGQALLVEGFDSDAKPMPNRKSDIAADKMLPTIHTERPGDTELTVYAPVVQVKGIPHEEE